MSGLATVCASLGAVVSGSDRRDSATVVALRELGMAVALGHSAANVPFGAEVVYSSAVPADNVERRRAAELGCRQIRRGELLAELCTMKRSIAVAGAHGKTTTAAMVLHVLRTAGLEPSHVIGAALRDGTAPAGWRKGEALVVETDESDGTFLEIRPEIATITNIDLEHTNQFASLEEVTSAFRTFAAGAEVALALEGTNGLDATLVAEPPAQLGPWGSTFTWRDVTVTLPLPGRHNVRNAVLALESCALVGVSPTVAARAVANFPGARRRLELVGRTATGCRVYDDYAHHATEIRASLSALRTVEAGRIVAVFEPHLYSRTVEMAKEYGEALCGADEVVVLEIFPAREAVVDHVAASGELVARAARDAPGAGPVTWAPTRDVAFEHLRRNLRADDACLIMGVGPTSWALARDLVGAGH